MAADALDNPSATLEPAPGGPGFPVVGLGASAGGLEALIRLIEAMPASTGMAFVAILHLSPKYPSNVAEILQKSTRMRVSQVTHTVKIEADHIYVIAPNLALSMVDGHLAVSEVSRVRGRPAVIDNFFRTLAHTHRERAMAVVLSGTGSDGSVGIADVKEACGVVLAQSLDDAQFDEMPRNAMGTGKVDIVLPAADIGQKLLDIWGNVKRITLPPIDHAPQEAPEADSANRAEAALREVMNLLRERTGHDFKHYKRATVLRRIERRLQVNGLPNLPAYQQYLERTPDETELLLGDMLIGVTNFFRDRLAFEALERHALPELFSEALHEEQLRVWVAGCSTGEEVYSLAMLLSHESGTNAHPRTLQFFATDIDARALARARDGKYPESVLSDIPPPLARRYLANENDGYRVNKGLRDKVLFAQHNLLRDPPFSRLDLVSCRNLLIYLDREVQKEILQMFHFALRPGGFLFLGSSETADAGAKLFTVVDKRHRIYRANASVRSSRVLPHFPLGGVERRYLPHAVIPPKPSPNILDLHQQAIVANSPPSLLVNADGEIVHSIGADRYLRFAPGVPTQHLLQVAQPELRAALRTSLFQVRQTGIGITARGGKLLRDGQEIEVTLVVQPVQQDDATQALTLILFHEIATVPLGFALEGGRDPMVGQLEAELHEKDGLLQKTVTQYEGALQDLKASNEELQAINEELRSATEELETSKEELQSTNEELITVNHELKMKVDETAEINDDLHNLITSSDMATVFVDRDMHIKRFTSAASSIFNIIPADIGRSLLDITHRLGYVGLADDVATTFNSLQTLERQVTSNDGREFLVRLLPYRTGEDRIDGAVLTFVDVTHLRRTERNVHLSEERMQLIASSMPDFAILTLDDAGRFTSWSLGAQRVLGYTEAEILGQPFELIFTDEDRRKGAPQQEMRTAQEQGRAPDERWHRRKDGSNVYLSGIMAPMRLGQLAGYAKIARDMTSRRQEDSSRAEALDSAVHDALEATAAIHAKDEFLAIMSHELKHPLNLIQLNAQLLMALPEAKAGSAVSKIGKTIQRTVRSQARIIDDLLDISRTQAGKLVLNPKRMQLATALQSSLAWAAKMAADKQIRFTADISDEPLPVEVDPTRIEQVALNLLSNALKFTPAGRQVTVALRREGDSAVFSVQDTGRGIAPEFLPEVFQLFKQAEPHENRSEGGLGIGLALVKDLVELHRGEVQATSAGLDQGARFTVVLPLCESSEFGSLRGSENVEVFAGLRVLAVDDTADTLDILKMLLELEGASVDTAQSAELALALLENGAPDLVLSDIGMPGVDGYQFIQRMRAMPGMADVPAVALTGYGRVQDGERALRSGFTAHLSKPIEMADLRAVLHGLGVRAKH